MSEELEAGGALATAGLAAHAIDNRQADRQAAGKAEKKIRCANCGRDTFGRFCHGCGQAAHVHRSLWHMLEEALHNVVHLDTKAWRTLPLLIFRPGLLTRRYIEGQRVRYVSPLALFLFMTFLMYFVFSFAKVGGVNGSSVDRKQIEDQRTELQQSLDAVRASVTKQSEALAAATTDAARASAESALNDARIEQRILEGALATVDATQRIAAQRRAPQEGENINGAAGPQTGRIDSGVGKSNEGFSRWDWGGGKWAKNPDLSLYKLKNTAYKFSFLLVPISLPFLWLIFFWRKDTTLYDHAIFSMYSLAFMSLFFSVLVLMTLLPATGGWVEKALWLPPVHIFLQLRETYRLRLWSTLWRTIAMLWFALLVALGYLILVATISAQ